MNPWLLKRCWQFKKHSLWSCLLKSIFSIKWGMVVFQLNRPTFGNLITTLNVSTLMKNSSVWNYSFTWGNSIHRYNARSVLLGASLSRAMFGIIAHHILISHSLETETVLLKGTHSSFHCNLVYCWDCRMMLWNIIFNILTNSGKISGKRQSQ